MVIPSDAAKGHCLAGPFLSNQSTYNFTSGQESGIHTTGCRKFTPKHGHTDESGYRSPVLKHVEIQREEIKGE